MTTRGKALIVSEAGEVTKERTEQPGDPCVMVIFGASGDLTKRKLIPALYNLARESLLSRHFAVIGFARRPMSNEEFRKKISQEIKEFATSPVDPQLWDRFVKQLYYLPGDVQDENSYRKLQGVLAQIDKERGTRGNYFYYLAMAPDFFCPIVQQLGRHGLVREENGQWRRVIIEKPFGHDLDSARELNQAIRQVLGEKQIYRIDHYLGKETVQNILVFRFGNGIFEPVWNRRYIDSVQITAAEKVGVEQRGGYYEQAGALRDMVPNHLLQLVTLTAMEPPISFGAHAVRDEQAKVLHAIQCPAPEEAARRSVRGQYDSGTIGDESAPAYRSEPNVAPDSNVE